MGLLPDQRRDGEIKFKLARSLPYRARLLIVFACFIAGFALQLWLGLWWGVPLVFAGTLLSLVSGYSTSVGESPRQREWKRCRLLDLERVIEVDRRNRAWDQSLLDITCGRGFFMLLLVGGSVALAGWYVGLAAGEEYGLLVWVDAGIVLGLQWLTGIRQILTNPALIIRTKNMIDAAKFIKREARGDESLEPMLEVGETKDGPLPSDARLMVRWPEGDENFLGLQVQVSINEVQGKSFPYVYCVIIARPKFGLHDRIRQYPPFTWELKSEGEVDIVVVRQHTTRQTGYHTKPAAVRNVIRTALVAAREAVGNGGK